MFIKRNLASNNELFHSFILQKIHLISIKAFENQIFNILYKIVKL